MRFVVHIANKSLTKIPLLPWPDVHKAIQYHEKFPPDTD